MPRRTDISRKTGGNRHALAARAAKHKAALAIGIDDAFISTLVDRFYDSVRKDDLLGPIFAARVSDWPTHLDRMKSFWSSVLHNSGAYSGNPMLKHLAIPGLDRGHFDRWLTLFGVTLDGLAHDPAAARTVQERARMIATSLVNGIVIKRGGLAAAQGLEDF
ncbi:MAG: group III truncated hemoglobin [Sphingomicrobium sp.]